MTEVNFSADKWMDDLKTHLEIPQGSRDVPTEKRVRNKVVFLLKLEPLKWKFSDTSIKIDIIFTVWSSDITIWTVFEHLYLLNSIFSPAIQAFLFTPILRVHLRTLGITGILGTYLPTTSIMMYITKAFWTW